MPQFTIPNLPPISARQQCYFYFTLIASPKDKMVFVVQVEKVQMKERYSLKWLGT